MKYLLLLSLMIIAVSCSESTENDSPDIILGGSVTQFMKDYERK